MLKKLNRQEDVVMIFFVVTLVCVGVYVLLGRALVDVIYFGIMIFYFIKFLRIKRSGK